MLAITGFMPGWAELVVLAIIGLLIFGRRLPEVGRSLGKGIVEFKKGIHGIEDEIESATTDADSETSYDEPVEREEATAPKFEPPAKEPSAGTDEV